MDVQQVSNESIPFQDIVLGHNARTMKPCKDRKGKHTPMKVVNDAAAQRTANKLHVPNGTSGAWLLLNDDGIERMDAERILETLLNGEAIGAPPVKKRGRKKKVPVVA